MLSNEIFTEHWYFISYKSVYDILRAHSRFVNLWGLHPMASLPTFYKHTMGPKYMYVGAKQTLQRIYHANNLGYTMGS